MKTETLTCNSCGAPLEVPEGANFVTCNHCSSQLAIRRSDSATFTEQLDRLTEQTEQLSSRVDHLSAQSEIAALDRQWELERERYMVAGPNGHKHLPTQSTSLVGGIFAAIFGVLWMIMASQVMSIGPSFGIRTGGLAGIFPLFGLLFVFLGIGGAISGYGKADRYRQAERRYKNRRRELQGQ